MAFSSVSGLGQPAPAAKYSVSVSHKSPPLWSVPPPGMTSTTAPADTCPIVTDGGIRTGGDVCKSIAAGADSVMIGSPFAMTREAPAKGMHWGMATWHESLPRGTRIDLGVRYGLEELLFGPSSRSDGTLNLVGALRVGMGYVGAEDIKQMHDARMVYAPAIKTEGKVYQMAAGGGS